MPVTWITPVTKTLGADATWTDIDVSANIGGTATAVVVHVVIDAIDKDGGVRKNGSTDARVQSFEMTRNVTAIVGVDGSQIFEGYAETDANASFVITGWLDGDYTANTNADDVSLAGINAWTDVDISTESSSAALMASLEMTSTVQTLTCGIRVNGSTDDRRQQLSEHGFWQTGVDGSYIFEGYINNLATDFFLLGWMTAGYTDITNGNSLAGAETAASGYFDLTAVTAGAIGAVFEGNASGAAERSWHVREKGATTDLYFDMSRDGCISAKVDASRLAEAKKEVAGDEIFEIGYYTSGAAPAATVALWQLLGVS